MKKELVAKSSGVVLSAVLLLTSLTGCQNTGTTDPTQSDTVDTAVHEPITILTGQQNYGAFAALLEERYPEIVLEFQPFLGGATSYYMQETLQQGDIPDIYTMTYVPDGSLQKENLLDLSSYSLVNEYSSITLDDLNVDGGIYMLPSRYGLLGIVYNKTLMEENNWEVPQSFAELKALAPEIEAAGYRVADMRSYLTGTTFGIFFALGNTNYFCTPEGDQWKRDFLKGEATATGSLETVTDYFQQWIDAGFISTYYYDHREVNVDDDFDSRQYVFQLYSNRISGNTDDEFGFLPFLSEDGSNNMLVRLVSRYYGLNKSLGEAGNEQKLEDALKVLALMGTAEGQAALSGGSLTEIPATSINELPEGSPYADVLPLINRGNMIDMVYSGWENHIVPLIEAYGNEWIRGNLSANDFLVGMDTLNQELLSNEVLEVLGTASEYISLDDTARLCAIALGKAADADAAMISMPAFHGFGEDGSNLENRHGVHSGIYQGGITDTTLRIFAPSNGTIVTVTMTGSEITALAEAGFTVEGDPTAFPYCLVTKGDIELEADQEYTLAIIRNELSDEALLERAVDTELEPLTSIASCITELGSISPEVIIW